MTRKTAKSILEVAFKDIPYYFNPKDLIIKKYGDWDTIIWKGHQICFDIIKRQHELRIIAYDITDNGEYQEYARRILYI